MTHSDQTSFVLADLLCFYVFIDGSFPGKQSQSRALQQRSNPRKCNQLLHLTAFCIQPSLQPHQVRVFTSLTIVSLWYLTDESVLLSLLKCFISYVTFYPVFQTFSCAPLRSQVQHIRLWMKLAPQLSWKDGRYSVMERRTQRYFFFWADKL